MGPNLAFCLVIFGTLGIYCEFIWPGRVWQAVAGSAAAVIGAYFFWHASPTAIGVELLALAVTLFLLDAFVETRFIAGSLATAALTIGFIKLMADPRAIRPVLALPWCLAFGAVTVALNWVTRRARRIKRA